MTTSESIEHSVRHPEVLESFDNDSVPLLRVSVIPRCSSVSPDVASWLSKASNPVRLRAPPKAEKSDDVFDKWLVELQAKLSILACRFNVWQRSDCAQPGVWLRLLCGSSTDFFELLVFAAVRPFAMTASSSFSGQRNPQREAVMLATARF